MYEFRLKDLVRDTKGTDKLILLCAKSTGLWLSVCSTAVSGTVLSAKEYLIILCARYNVSPTNLLSHCDKCGTVFRVTHTLSCSIGGLIIACHNKIRDKLLYLSRRAFTSAYVRNKPLIRQGHTRSDQEIRQGSDKHKDTHGASLSEVYGIIKLMPSLT